jgi:hypothetical protein
VADIYAIKGLSDAEKNIIKKYEARFLALEPQVLSNTEATATQGSPYPHSQPEYVIDKINNGLYK